MAARSVAAALAAGVAFATMSCAAPTRPSGVLEAPERFHVLLRANGTELRDTLPVPPDQVWELLPATYRDIGLPAAPARNGKDRAYVTPHMEIEGRPLYPGERTSDYILCAGAEGERATADNYQVTFVVMTWLKPTDDGRTVIETLIDGHARSSATNANSVPCQGTGKLEQQIAEILRRRAGLPPATR